MKDNESKPPGTVPDNKPDTILGKLHIEVINTSKSQYRNQDDRKSVSKIHLDTDSEQNTVSIIKNNCIANEYKNNSYRYAGNGERITQKSALRYSKKN